MLRNLTIPSDINHATARIKKALNNQIVLHENLLIQFPELAELAKLNMEFDTRWDNTNFQDFPYYLKRIDELNKTFENELVSINTTKLELENACKNLETLLNELRDLPNFPFFSTIKSILITVKHTKENAIVHTIATNALLPANKQPTKIEANLLAKYKVDVRDLSAALRLSQHNPEANQLRATTTDFVRKIAEEATPFSNTIIDIKPSKNSTFRRKNKNHTKKQKSTGHIENKNKLNRIKNSEKIPAISLERLNEKLFLDLPSPTKINDNQINNQVSFDIIKPIYEISNSTSVKSSYGKSIASERSRGSNSRTVSEKRTPIASSRTKSYQRNLSGKNAENKSTLFVKKFTNDDNFKSTSGLNTMKKSRSHM